MDQKIDPERIVPKDGGNPYANHPGFVAEGCPIRYTVTPRNSYGVQVGGGFGCHMTGGHCLPGEHCDKRRADAKLQDERAALFEQARQNHPQKVYINEYKEE
jgi:hypothetical protein